MIELRGYIDERGKKRFADWIEQLEHVAAARVTVALARLEQGKDGEKLVILLGGGTKKASSKTTPTP